MERVWVQLELTNSARRFCKIASRKNYAYQFKHSEGGGGNYFYLGYIYHGENEYNIDGHEPFLHYSTTASKNQASERHKITLCSHEQRENIVVKVNGNPDDEFRLQWCEDASVVCKSSTPMTESSSKNDYNNMVQYLLNSQVEYSGSFNVALQVTGTSKSNLPAFDGDMYRYYSKWNWIWNNKEIDFKTNPDLCMAVKSTKQGGFRVHYSYMKHPNLNDPDIHDDDEAFVIHKHMDFTMERTGAGLEWDHFCMDIFTPIRTYLEDNNLVHTLFPSIKFTGLRNTCQSSGWYHAECVDQISAIPI